MSNTSQLFTLPPSKARGFGTHAQTHESMHARTVKVSQCEAESVITDNLLNRDGDIIVNTQSILLAETASQDTPEAGQGRFWVRSDTPSKLIFTNDAGTDTPLSPALEDVLLVGEDAGNLGITNLASLDFNAGIEIGSVVDASTTTSTEIAIGNGATSSAAYATVIGANSSCDNSYGVAVGFDCDIVSVAPNADDAGGVAIGASINSYGQGICVGRSITNTVTNQDGTNANILIGQNITFTGSVGEAIAIGSSVVPAPKSCIIGASAASLGGSNQVCIGKGAQVGSIGSISIGDTAYGAVTGDLTGDGNLISVGYLASATGKNSIAIGKSSIASAEGAVAFGFTTESSGIDAIAIGGGKYGGANASGTGSIAIGSGTDCAHANSICLGADVESRIADEFSTRAYRIIRATLQTTDASQTAILNFPTVASDVLHVDATITAIRSDSSVSYMSVFNNYHFRNKVGVLSQSIGIGEQIEDTLEVAYTSSIGLNGTNIQFEVTGISGHTVNWVCILKVYGVGLA